MDEQLYSIKESTLTNISDALRRYLGETEIVTVYEKNPTPNRAVDKTPNAVSHLEFGEIENNILTYTPIKIENAKSIKVILSQSTTVTVAIASGAYKDVNTFPWGNSSKYQSFNGELYQKPIIFQNTDTITIYCSASYSSANNRGYYADIIGLDENLNELPDDNYIEIPVEQEVRRTYNSSEIASAITIIGEGLILPPEAYLITGDCDSRFKGWDWYIKKFGDQTRTENITSAKNMFYGTTLREIPFDINMTIPTSTATQEPLLSMFLASNIANPPKIYLSASSTDKTKHKVFIEQMFSGNDFVTLDKPFIFKNDEYVTLIGIVYNFFNNFKAMEQEPTWLFDLVDWEAARAITSEFGSPFPISWSGCYKLKTIPSLPKFWNNYTGYYMPYSYLNFQNCWNLQELTLPRAGTGVRTNSSVANSAFSSTYTLKRIRFDVQEDGTPYTCSWKGCTIDFCQVGSCTSAQLEASMNKEKRVIDDESYQRLKNDPEYWVGALPSGKNTYGYSGYNHDSAVETLNTIFDASAYGTNTIKFRGVSGEYTDAGAINTLTEEEIAVATAKGWTVAFV